MRFPVPTAPRFPLIPLIAPLAVSGVLFLLIRSPYVAVFALLGPVMALATWWEAKRHYRQSQKQNEEALRDDERRIEREQGRDDEAFRARQLERYPHPSRWLDNPLWQPQHGERGVMIRLGLCSAPRQSGRLLTGVPGAISMAEADERFFDLERAYRLARLVLVGVSGDALRALRIPPVPATSAAQGWRLGPSGAELIQLEPLALGEDRIDADRVDS